ncbi:B3 domain-containing protein [Raphanus sativus]|uniref:B3 domain-containing protein At5g25470 n=1 Tax=Raphanus sativus TaxID=3726 RepID=A0A9W3CAK8_RAPSA|nr:B3 domain-containing protein At5g25470 [Raphanus sativus]XP_056858262.1 B3 domain-containing protein At5g25470-like [Raphanus sativus]KAJ4865882.1 B3 domain-containing protein [Raphanus sativus]KAJ4881489.1 B3 domain-containing protein [Raphanus sativus]
MSNPSSFTKSLSLGQNWKSKSMRIIPEELVRSNGEAFEHRVVFNVRWNNSWQLWLQKERHGLFMVEEDWDEFVDDNLLGADDILLFTHQDTMYFEVRIFKKDGKEITSVPLEVEPETQPFHQETTPASASASVGTSSRARKGFAHVKNPKRYLLNPRNPYFQKKLTKSNTVLYMTTWVIEEYELEFSPPNTHIYFLLPDGEKLNGYTKNYGGSHGFLGWAAVCERYNLKTGDTVVCELELSGRLVSAVRVHFVNA